MYHFRRSPKGIFYYSDETKTFGVISERSVMRDSFDEILSYGEFLGDDLKGHSIKDEPLAFLEALPRVMGVLYGTETSEEMPK